MSLLYRGTNLTGGDTLYSQWADVTKGPVANTNYLFVSNADIDYCVSKGMNVFRLVFGWEALQPTPNANITSLTGNFLIYYNRFKQIVDYITLTKKCTCIIDIHGGADSTFAAYYGVKLGGSYNGFTVESLLVNLWTQLATVFKTNPNVMFGIMNEPTNIPTLTWFTAAQKIINAIRAQGANQKICMPGNYFSGAGSWTYTGSMYDTGTTKRSNAYGWENANGTGKPLVDPAMNTCVQVHLYFDQNSGGGDNTIANDAIGATRLADVVTWARKRGLQVMVGEIGLSAANAIAPATWQKTVDYMKANSDVIIGYQFWAYGPPTWWGSYRFTLCPKSNYTVDSAQMNLIEASLADDPTSNAELEALRAQVVSLQNDLQVQQTSIASLQSRVTLLTADLATSQNQNLSLQEQLSNTQNEYNSMREAYDNCSSLLTNEQQVTADLKSTMTTIKEIIDSKIT